MTISLRAYRVNKGSTIKQVAEALEVSPITIRKWEKGESKPKTIYLNAMAQMYDVESTDIFLGKNYTKE